MVSEQYRASANHMDEYLCDSDSEEEELDSNSEEENSEIVFGTFRLDSNLDATTVILMKSIKLVTDGSSIKIGETTCTLVGPNSDAAPRFLDPESGTCIVDLVSEAAEKSEKELITKVCKKVDLVTPEPVNLAPDSPVVDSHRVDLSIVSFVNLLCDSGSAISDFILNMVPMILAPVNYGSATIALPATPPPWFSTEETTVTTAFFIGSCVWLSGVTGVFTADFDPCRTLKAACKSVVRRLPHNQWFQRSYFRFAFSPSCSCNLPEKMVERTITMLSLPPPRSVFVFDLGGNRRRLLLISTAILSALRR